MANPNRHDSRDIDASVPQHQGDVSAHPASGNRRGLPQYTLTLHYDDNAGLMKTAFAIMRVMSVPREVAAAQSCDARRSGSLPLRVVHMELGELFEAMFARQGLKASLKPLSST